MKKRRGTWLIVALALTALIVVAASVTAAATTSAAPATRAQFAETAVEGLGLEPVYPANPTYSDVLPGQPYYGYVEGATQAGLVRGLTSGQYGPDLLVARQQVATILARYLTWVELDVVGYITGTAGAHYLSLAAWYAAEGEAQLARFADQATIFTMHRPGVAYLVMHGIALGSNGSFIPLAPVTLSQCEALVQRAAVVAASFAPETPAPAITSLDPSSGTAAGGTTVYINGSGFTAGAAVYFGGTPALAVTVNSSTLITAVSPAGTAGATVRVSVATEAGTSPNTSRDDFTYFSTNPPTISYISPSSGWKGDAVTVLGTNFDAPNVRVYFGGVEATSVRYISSSELVAIVPAGTDGSTVRVTVVTSYGTTPATPAIYFTYDSGAAPTISALVPDYGWEGDTVVIYGSNFDEDGLQVFFGSEEAAYVTYHSPTMLKVIVPEGNDGYTVRVRVVTVYGTSPNTPADDFTYSADWTPGITSIDPDSGWVGDTVTIRGNNLAEAGLQVFFGAEQVVHITYVSPTKLRVIVPAGTDGQTVRVRVVTVYGTSPNTPADDFTYDSGVVNDAPVITALIPDYGWVGDTVTIHGQNFDQASVEVYFDGEQADVTWVSNTELSVVVPTGHEGPARVTVVTAYGTSPNTGAAWFVYDEDSSWSRPRTG